MEEKQGNVERLRNLIKTIKTSKDAIEEKSPEKSKELTAEEEKKELVGKFVRLVESISNELGRANFEEEGAQIASNEFARVLKSENGKLQYVVQSKRLGERRAVIEALIGTIAEQRILKVFAKSGEELLKATEKLSEVLDAAGIQLSNDEKAIVIEETLKEFNGNGLFEEALNDNDIERIIIPGAGKNLLMQHKEFGTLQSNILLLKRDIGALAEKLAGLKEIEFKEISEKDDSIIILKKVGFEETTLEKLVSEKVINSEAAILLEEAVGSNVMPANILIIGKHGSGNERLLNALSQAIPKNQLVAIQGNSRLSIEESQAVHITRGSEKLVNNIAALMPERFIVPELENEEILPFFEAVSSGINGIASINSKGLEFALNKLLQANENIMPVQLQVIDLVIFMQSTLQKGRKALRITLIAEIIDTSKREAKIQKLFEWNPETDLLEKVVNAKSKYFEKLAKIKQ